ncbi:MAG: Smr/MutS family protein [SAR324 cluster bacterium]|nr:Smr/MutS family protein [SAR324 cluster bacterium]
MRPALQEPTTPENLEWERVTALLESRLVTEYGRQEAQGLAPLPDIETVHRSLARVGEMMALEAEYGAPDFAGVRHIGDLLDRAEKDGRLTGEELVRVLATQQAAVEAARKLRLPDDAHLLRRLAGRIDHLGELCDELSASLMPGGDLNERAFPYLEELREKITRRRDRVHRMLDGLLHSRVLAPMLQEKIYSVRGSRYVLPLKTDFRGQLKGIVHDVSASGATLFVEPESVVDETNSLVVEERRYAKEIENILDSLSVSVGQAAAALRKNCTWLGRIDLIAAQARLAKDYHGVLPEVGEDSQIDLRGAAHPLMLLEGADVVRNDVKLGGEIRCLVVTGANTGGKTVLLKTVGLCVLLVAHGMPVPALTGSRVDRFAYVEADIGDQQNLSFSLSTFSARIQNLARMLERAGKDSIVLIDEILTGTEPHQGAALAQAVLEALVARGALCLVTTHYGELKSLAAERPGFVNASVTFDPDRFRPTYRLRVGLPGSSYAFSIARRHGLAEELVGAAECLAESSAQAPDALLHQLHREEAASQKRAADLDRRELAVSEDRAELVLRQDDVTGRERELRRRERSRIGAELKAARKEIASVMKGLHGSQDLADASRAKQHLTQVENQVRASLAEPATRALPPLDWDRIQAGDGVYLPSLQQMAVFEVLLDKGQRARLRMGGLVFEVSVSALAAVPPERTPRRPRRGGSHPAGIRGAADANRGTSAAAPGEAQPGPIVMMGEENTLDLRGLRLADALDRTEQFFDFCVFKHVSPVLLIHGHGSGRLKTGIRTQLIDNPYVAAYRAGEGREGGDGVTVVALNL